MLILFWEPLVASIGTARVVAAVFFYRTPWRSRGATSRKLYELGDGSGTFQVCGLSSDVIETPHVEGHGVEQFIPTSADV
jgi:hypothetical protein